ncbi:MAG: DUF4835 family protein [Ignavibacteriaceae bacterium]|jgi:hypothetical protein|nr:DUF4835 family protein [Ignavibacteriaceae bacterium]MCU0406202.1 DUF4835 family protein [Ignavibacteriaceae bacterium]MCU0413044.1 DUF4835 family protein [Ignavibacteriaceae bacterium]
MKYTVLFLLFLSSLAIAQELNCRVEVNYQNLPVNNRELLTDFAGVIENYMNTTRFTNVDWGQKIDCSLSIFFTGASSDVDYSAQIVIVSQRPIYKSTKNSPILTVNDGQWQFKYQKGQALYPNQTTFDPLTSFLDYYANIIIGMDSDTFEPAGGTPYFKRAQDIVNLGSNSGSSLGWQSSSATYSRWGLVNDILSATYSFFRNSIFDYHYGIDVFSQNKQLGQPKIESLVNVLWVMYEKLGSINSVYVRTFFDAKHGELIDYLSDYPDPEIFSKLKKIDPPHSSKYDAVMP